jgi:nucleotide-binding universal stress UspA family protein
MSNQRLVRFSPAQIEEFTEDQMNVLVAIDGSQISNKVIEVVAARPWPAHTSVCVLNVIDWQQLPMNAALLQEMKQAANLLVTSARTRLSNAGLPTTTAIIEAHPRTAVAGYAKERAADFVFVGSRGAGRIARLLLGSVAEATLHRSSCSVEIVRDRSEQNALVSGQIKVLLCTDGSECSMAAVTSIAQRPWPPASQVRLISVLPLIIPFGQTVPMAPAYYPSSAMYEELMKISRGRAEEAVAWAEEIFRGTDIRPIVAKSLPVGDPRAIILDEATRWCAGLIVLGSHGYRGIDRIMLGSVSEFIAMHAHCSVEVIREPAASHAP